ncbi:MAG TPA: protocadherin, partial [Pirellulales bacterium]|nr:protocadherin [Pirellulales bacterium]
SNAVAPIYYNYGDNVTYQDGSVYYGDQVYATQEQFADQSAQIAAAGLQATPPPDDQWQSLGVFAMVQGDETNSNDLFQLALDANGTLRGNYYNAISDSTTPLSGSLDKTSQRLAWTLDGKKTPVYETGLYNVTQAETTMLVHFGKDRTEQYKLFRLEQPENDSGTSP